MRSKAYRRLHRNALKDSMTIWGAKVKRSDIRNQMRIIRKILNKSNLKFNEWCTYSMTDTE